MRASGVIGAWSLLAACAVLLGGCAGSGSLEREVRRSEAPFAAEAPLRVVTANGGIEVVESAEAVVQIRAEVRAETPERLAATTVIADRLEDGTLSIGVAWPEGKRQPREGCSFFLTLPRASGVELRTSNGSIHVEEMGGAAVLTTTNGAVEVVSQGGPVNVETSNGAVRIDGAAGQVRAATSNGSVRVEGAETAVDVETSNGTVAVALTDAAAGPVRIRSSNGRVDLRLGRGFQGELSLKTSGGRLDLEGLPEASIRSLEGGAARIRIGEGRDASSVQTSNGAIRVRGAGG